MDEVSTANEPAASNSFFDRPGVKVVSLPIGQGVPFGIESVSNPELGIGGAYGTWGACLDNASLPDEIEHRLGLPLGDSLLNLSELGFLCRHHVPDLTPDEHIELEIEVGARFLRAAAQASGWDAAEVDAVLVLSLIHI